jgi:hypothetical protein
LLNIVFGGYVLGDHRNSVEKNAEEHIFPNESYVQYTETSGK